MSYLTQFATAAAGATVQTITGDVGGALSPTANNINLLGGNVLTTTGAGSTLTFDLDNGTNGQLLIGGGADPAWATMTSADASVTIALGANTIDLSVAGGALDVITDSGTATKTAGEIDILGGTNINTAGATNIVTVNLDAAITLATSVTSPIYQTDAGTDLVLNMADDAATYAVSFTNNSDAEVAYIDSLGAASFTELDVDNININGNTIISSDVNGDITFTPNGSGTVNFTYLTEFALVVAGNLGEVDDLIDGLGSSGEVLTSNGAGAEPTWQVTAAGSSFTAGSVIFSNGTTLAEDNANFFWDDTNNRLGIGTTTPLDSLHIIDGMCLEHTAAESDDHALEVICDAAGFGDVKAIDINFTTGAIAGGISEEAILVNIDETSSTGGEIFGIEVLATAGLATAFGLRTGVTVGPVAQFSGTFVDADTILVLAVDQTAALANGGAGNVTTFVLDNDTMTIGDAAMFGEMEVIIDTPASGAGIAPTFEYSTGVGTWATFSPTDGTNGMRNTGEIAWDPADIAWIIGTGSEFLIRITRTRNVLGTVPILDEIQISATTSYTWDKDGEISILSLIVADLTQYTLPIAGVSGALDDLADGIGSSGEVLTSNGAGSEPTWQASGASATFPTDAGTATPAVGALTVAGGTNIATSGAGSTVTINFDGTLPVASGGTGATTLTDNGVLIGSGTGAVTAAAVGTNGQLLIGSTGLDPAFATVTSTGSTIDFTLGASTLNFETAAKVATSYTCDAGSAVPAVGVLTIAGGTNIATSGAGSTATINFDGTLPVASGGTGATTLTDNGVLIGSGTGAVTAAAVGTNGQLLIGSTGADPVFATLASSNSTISISGGAGTLDIDVSAPLNVATGGSGRTSHTAYAVICGGTTTTAAQQSIASVGTAAQVLTSNGAGALPTFQAAPVGGIAWNEETGTSATMAVDNGYIANNVALVTLTLPTTAAVGVIVRVAGKGAGGWKIAQNASEIIHFGTTDTTTGVGGSLASSETYDSVELLCIVADTEWVILSSLGNITIV